MAEYLTFSIFILFARAMLRGMTFHSIESYEGTAAGDEVIEDIISRLNNEFNLLVGSKNSKV